MRNTNLSRLAAAAGHTLAGTTAASATGSPIAGAWYNSYCSQVELAVGPDNSVSGTYTSHTGATGSYNIVGHVGAPAVAKNSGTPVALAIQWRIINLPASQADGSWHWVSNFAGQYHPAQTVSVPGQQPYTISETLELLNMLIATSVVPGFNAAAPLMWPQTLLFHKTPPSYCIPVTPPPPVPYQSLATDHVSGTWVNAAGDLLTLSADIPSGSVSGQLITSGGAEIYDLEGLFDNFSDVLPGVTVAEQGVSIALHRVDGFADVMSMAGGVSLPSANTLTLFTNQLASTEWTSRYLESTVDKVVFQRQ